MARLPLAALLAATTIASAQAANFSGEVWQNTDAAGNVALAPTGEHATFGVDALNGAANADTNPAAYTVGDFLATFPGFTGFSNQSVGFNPTGSLSTSGTNPAGPNPGTFFRFTGPISLASDTNTFTATHDDGLDVSLSGFGKVLDSSGPTSPRTDTFTVDNTSGVSSAVLTADYGECCRGPAVLQTDFHAAAQGVLEPASGGLLLGMLGMFGLVGWRRKAAGSSPA